MKDGTFCLQLSFYKEDSVSTTVSECRSNLNLNVNFCALRAQLLQLFDLLSRHEQLTGWLTRQLNANELL